MAWPLGPMTAGPQVGSTFSETVPLAADEYLRADSGRFLYESGSGNYTLCGASSPRADLWAFTCFQVIHNGDQGETPYPQQSTFTAGSFFVEGTRECDEPRYACWIPSDDTLVATDVGTQCELIIIGSTISRVQKVKPSVVTTPIVKIIAVDLANNIALVHAIRV